MSENIFTLRNEKTGEEMAIDPYSWDLAWATLGKEVGKDGKIKMTRENAHELFTYIKLIQRGRNQLRNQQRWETIQGHKNSGHQSMSAQERYEVTQEYYRRRSEGTYVNQDLFSAEIGISISTLRRWLREFDQEM